MAPAGTTKLAAVSTHIQYLVAAVVPRMDVSAHTAQATIDA